MVNTNNNKKRKKKKEREGGGAPRYLAAPVRARSRSFVAVSHMCSWGVFVQSRVVSVRARSRWGAFARPCSCVFAPSRGIPGKQWLIKKRNEKKKRRIKETERGRTSLAPCSRSRRLVSVRARALRPARSQSCLVASFPFALVRSRVARSCSWGHARACSCRCGVFVEKATRSGGKGTDREKRSKPCD